MRSEDRRLWRELELGFGGGTKFRVTRHLIQNHKEAFTKYGLVKATGLKTDVVESQLETLLKINWVRQYPFTPATYQINLENEVVKQVLDLFQKLRYVRRET